MIRNLPSRAPEIGRLTCGEKGKKGEPVALDTWRARCPDELTTLAVASIYGGDVKPCAAGGFEVVTEASEINVLLPPDSLTAWYERWGKGGCQRRCDGERCVTPVEGPDGGHLEEVDCVCADQGLTPGDDKEACAVSVRLKVVLPDVPGLGIWLVISGSVNAAIELPAQVNLLEQLAARGALIPAVLAVEKREKKKPWEKFTRRFGVPVLRVHQSMDQLSRLQNGGTPAAIESAAPALPAAPSQPPKPSRPRAARAKADAESPPGAPASASPITVMEAQKSIAAAKSSSPQEAPEGAGAPTSPAPAPSVETWQGAARNGKPLSELTDVFLRTVVNQAPDETFTEADAAVARGELERRGGAS